MAYFLGRDVSLAINTEQEAFGLKLNSGALDITGTSSISAADTDPIPPRVYGLKDVGTASVAEVSTMTTVSATETLYESTSSGSNKYITLYDPDGDAYVIDFNCTDSGSSYVQSSQAAAATASLTITLTTSTGSITAIAGAIADQINADATFSGIFSAANDGATNSITNTATGDATDIAKGSAMGGIMNVGTTTQGVDRSNKLNDVTGLDVTIGAIDEDIAYFGQRTGLKAEIKKETTIAVTRKKSDSLFSQLFNLARCGIRHTSGTIDADIGETDGNLAFDNNLTKPETTSNGSNFGYRLFVQMKESSEVMTLMNACITDYSTTLNADGITEETITFYSYTTPKIQTTSYTTISSQSEF